jgi:hypothetical protein
MASVCEHDFANRVCYLHGSMVDMAVCRLCAGACLPQARLMSGWPTGKPPWQAIDDAGNLERLR